MLKLVLTLYSKAVPKSYATKGTSNVSAVDGREDSPRSLVQGNPFLVQRNAFFGQRNLFLAV